MIRRGIIVLVVLAGLLLASLPAGATCIPGRIALDPKTGKVTIELPRCEPPPQQ